MDQVKENKMGSKPMFGLIMTMSLPAMFSMLVQSLYNIVDSYFVAKLGTQAFTAVSLAFPIQMLILSVAIGTGIGINSVVSRRLGEGNKDKASKAATHGLFLALISGVVFAVLGILFTKMFLQVFTSDPAILKMGCDYTYIVTIFSVGIFMEINIEKTLQATGNMIYPMMFQLSGAITNIILDPILIFGLFGFPKMGVVGAAVATVVGQMVAMTFSIIIVEIKSHDVHIAFKGFRFEWKTIRDIYAVGFPAIIMQSIASVLTTALNGILIGFSEAAVNVLGVYFKLQSFVFMPVFGLMQGVMPVLGYNYGARNRKRVVSALKIGTAIAIVIMALGTILFASIPDKLLRIFNANAEMLEIGVVAFRLICICFIPAAIGIMSSTLFQAIGMGTRSLIISVLRQLVVLLPAAYLFSFWGVNYVWLAFPLSEMISLIVAISITIAVFKKNINTLTPLDNQLVN
ncbi:MATE family efflux transporter [Paludicola sp. MB14-C6]|uniref:MATE family efflux transporter n=1 Tax=Paludihabitans sp. MB14-C6 TaxID=3070656 RepID=UPI0027DDF1ED|nr:MATE family efflux transporter [Paludicola sp. MB14-C6]WMJ22112.1 MATE family efflux transporter [Paludicola sp. MB14-C6]